MKKIKSLAICGIRGIPASYGGFETFAEEISPRLVELGASVRVYGRKDIVEDVGSEYRGVNIVLLPTIKHKYAETPVHSLLSFIHLLLNPTDVVLVCNGANSPFVWLLKLRGIPVIINVDGIERKRSKWNRLGKLWYLLGERCSVKFANILVSDAKVISDYYLETYGKESTVIPYGYDTSSEDEVLNKLKPESFNIDVGDKSSKVPEDSDTALSKLGLSANSYILYVSRLEPENNAHIVIEAYKMLLERLKTESKKMDFPLVIVGDAPYAKNYIQSLHQLAREEGQKNPKIIFTGYLFGSAYKELQLGARLYVQATEVGGTHPALVEAMGYGNCIIANNSAENAEVLKDSGELYDFNSVKDLARIFGKLVFSEDLILHYRKKAFDRAKEEYSWVKISNDYSQLIQLLAGPESHSKVSPKTLNINSNNSN